MIHESRPAPAPKARPLSTSERLLLAPLQEKGGGQFEAVLPKRQQVRMQELTYLERAYLERKHGSRRLHPTRPQVVKMMRENGFSAHEIAALHRGQKGWGQRQIEKDIAALSEVAKITANTSAMR